MKSSNLLLTLVYAAAGFVLITEVACNHLSGSLPSLCGASGLPCRNSSECCDNYCCVAGVCQQSTNSVCNTCDGVVCPENETCQAIKDPNCRCKDVPQCFPFVACNKFCIQGYVCVIDYTTNPPSSKCVPKNDPCANVTCPEFQQCYYEESKCLLDPKEPVPVCAYSNPCSFVNCPRGSLCSTTQDGNSAPKAECVAVVRDPCYAVMCPENQTCYQRDVVCVRAPCPPVAACAYPDPCQYSECPDYFKCVVQQEGRNPPTAECVLDQNALCADVVCPTSQRCYLRNVTCVATPCLPEPTCAYYNACTLARCAQGYKCVSVDNGYYPPTATCIPNRDYICQNTVCPQEQKCYLQDVGCATHPCSPRPLCEPSNPCLTTDCGDGNICRVVDQGDYPPTTECVPNPQSACSAHVCPLYQQCYLQQVYCYVPPCPPQPVCAYPNPCMFVNCGEGYNCVEVRKDSRPPTAYCLQNYDLCAGVICQPGYSCYVKDTECTDFECYPIPPTTVCAVPAPCNVTSCPGNYSCTSIQVRTNPPVAKCVPPQSPCAGVACQSGEKCYIKDYDCNASGCFDVQPVAVCSLPDPCIATQCLTNQTCLVVQIRRNPPEALCGQLDTTVTTCDNYTCDQGLQCFMKDYQCNEFRCTNTNPRPVCSSPNPCQTTICDSGTICITEQLNDNPPSASCKSISRLCDTTTCPYDQQCYIQDYQCDANGCSRISQPYPVCASPSPCGTAGECPANSACTETQIRNNPPQPQCVLVSQHDLCNSTNCTSGYSCYIKDTECDGFQCRAVQPTAVCALHNPCTTILCSINTTCTVSHIRNNPPQAQCKPITACTNVTCTPCEDCFIKDFECDDDNVCRYVEPTGVCAYADPCSVTNCAGNGTCFVHQIRDNPPVAICEHVTLTCDTIPCIHGKMCYEKDYKCHNYTCCMIEPMPLCARIDPCTDVTCPADTVCNTTQIRNNPPQAVCVPYGEVCNNVQCAPGEKCYIVQVFCVTTPCPPQPMCRPVDPCAGTTCLPGYKCVNRQYGVSPPFADCVEQDDPCEGVNCTDGQQCYLRKVPCTCPPCRYEPVCSYANPCVNALCPTDHGCYPKRVGRLEPVPVCYPEEDPCKAYDCLPGQECFITTRPCVDDLPCPVPECTGDPVTHLCDLARCGPGYECVIDTDAEPWVAKCVPLEDPCEYTVCPKGSMCLVLDSYPQFAICANVTVPKPCSVVSCKRGYRCVETKPKPAYAVCVPTCKLCPPTTDCIIDKSFPPSVHCRAHPQWLLM